ncbi:helix-turn-helix transcriptional regulator [Leifsonia sp. SIMBA_070]|uniref:helix-turn-helix transcriptional regulator n=1 Tax=Leifsonia sp. SIMBA_070 TaxID=3085810 RepID=UPI003977E68D
MNRTDRLYALVEALRAVAPRPLSARRLAERFEVSTRTIERDLSALQQAGVPIWAEPGRTGGYCIDVTQTLPPLGLTVDEALAVTIGLGMLASSPFRNAASAALGKVLAVMDTGAADETRELALRVHLLENTEAPATAPDGFADALRAGSVLRLQYRDREGAETEREVEPLGYVGRDGSWYLVAWCRTRNGIRAFRGDRILSVERTGERPPRRPLTADDLQIAYGELRPAYREE